ncbi:MAG: 4-(cytidine 5'-diphospho)-2-C-methyl-D-erythritol kinase [candidate division NC10 bacterium]|nr:4-(cytidine 5'-diphospho)-2-C-methyl-D-erythritol kinase [candidate division NC10 bacterium]
MDALTLPSLAKINLFLEVLAKRDDGYHEIRSVFQLIDLCDQVTVTRKEEGIAVRVKGDAPSGRENLAYQAAELLFKETGLEGGVEITIEKRIPVGGGLGGGSSNAAATLWGLNLLFGLRLSSEALMDLGARLGADVPFFFSGGLAFAAGRGERLQPLPPLTARWVVVANPGVSISTAWAYRTLDLPLTDETLALTIKNFLLHGEGEKALSLSFNRLEEVVLPRHPEVARLKGLLASWGADPVLMSGSGSSIFGMVPERRQGEAMVERLQEDGIRAVLSRTLDHNPLFNVRILTS